MNSLYDENKIPKIIDMSLFTFNFSRGIPISFNLLIEIFRNLSIMRASVSVKRH